MARSPSSGHQHQRKRRFPLSGSTRQSRSGNDCDCPLGGGLATRLPFKPVRDIFNHHDASGHDDGGGGHDAGGYDEREFWQRVEARNKGTAAELDRLGLAEYFAMEAYVVE